VIKPITVAIALALAGPALAHEGAKQDAKKPARAAAPIPVEETAFGREGDPKRVSRTINIEMTEMRFTPDVLAVKQGETIRFRAKNSGQATHEIVLGTLEGLKEHAAMMRMHPGMEHDEPFMAHVAPGKTETIVWQFTKQGEFHYGCLIPGHFEAGMTGRIRVAAK
jgi:uncharacterized cupredoxin-like copper-binding protein